MSQFKRFNTSDNGNWDDYATYPAGTLTWDQNNGLRIHDGSTGGGNPVGGNFDGNYWNLTNRPYGASAIHDVIGGGSSANTGKFLMQTDTTSSEWTDSIRVWKSGINVVNPEVSVPGLTISFYGNNILLINSSGSPASFTWAGRKITSSSVESLHSTGTSIQSTENTTITTLAAGRGDTVVLDHVYNVDQGVIYRVTVICGWSLSNYGQIIVERLI